MSARVASTRKNADGYKVRTYVDVDASGKKTTWKTVEVPIEVLRRSATRDRLESARRAVEREARRLKVERLLQSGMTPADVSAETGMSSSGVYLLRAQMQARAKALAEKPAASRAEVTLDSVWRPAPGQGEP